jgi:flagellar motor switch protein FliN/FliY
MTTDMTVDGTPQSFSIKFLNAVATAMAKASGSPWVTAALPDAESASDGAEPVWIELMLDGSLHGSALLQFRRAEAIMLAGKILDRPADEFGAEEAEGLLKLIDAGIKEFLAAPAQGYGAFTIKASGTAEPSIDRTDGSQITISDDEGSRLSILMYVDSALAEALQSRPVGELSGNSMKAAAVAAMPDPVNLNLVMDVELNVTLRFGQRQLTLREVLELTSGSVVELDRQVEEPVELLLDGKVIARGEAVVIDGNYGLRVTEVSQPIFSPALR